MTVRAMSKDADRIVGLYQERAREWDDIRPRALMEKAWLDRFIGLLPAGGSVLDIGCGAGEPIARYLIEAGLRLTGVDSSPAMIAMCCERFPEREWIVADMRTLALERCFDGLLAWDSFFHLTPEDQRAMFPIFGAHAGPRAALMFTSGPRHGEAIGTLHGEPLYHGSLDPVEYHALLAVQGFAVASTVADDPTCGGHTIWLAQRKSV
jgi:SAM-dependent methyltransferase